MKCNFEVCDILKGRTSTVMLTARQTGHLKNIQVQSSILLNQRDVKLNNVQIWIHEKNDFRSLSLFELHKSSTTKRIVHVNTHS